MKRLVFSCLLLQSLVSFGQDLQFSGQASVWGNYNQAGDLDFWAGGRYLPQLNYTLADNPGNHVDFEASVNLNGAFGTLPFDSLYSQGSLKPYRLWARYSTTRFELRAGLQKINFGSATMIRPLMWFDKVDPRDPIKFTDGVWGLLGRYYFLNNANLWLWVLYGNDEPKTWEIGNTSQDQPEYGGRFQYPVANGQIALSGHHRLADIRSLDTFANFNNPVPENRLGFDGKWDIEIGLWVEAVWFNRSRNIGSLTNQTVLSAGADYTFGVGNGINVIYEQLFFAYSEKPFRMNNNISFSTLSVNYPLGFLDNLSALIYYDWTNNDLYNMLTWNRQFNNLSLYFIGYHNPRHYQVPLSVSQTNLYAGTGFQVMLVFNH